MKKAMLGAFLSGLVYPGVGQMTLKYTKRGIFFIVITSMSLLWIVLMAVQKALLILNQIPIHQGTMDFRAIYAAAQKAVTSTDGTQFKLALASLALIWLISTVDAYRLGKQMDIKSETPFELP